MVCPTLGVGNSPVCVSVLARQILCTNQCSALEVRKYTPSRHDVFVLPREDHLLVTPVRQPLLAGGQRVHKASRGLAQVIMAHLQGQGLW